MRRTCLVVLLATCWPQTSAASGFSVLTFGGRRVASLASLASPDDATALFHNPAGIEPETLGTGPQRRYRIGAAAYGGGLLFVLELFAEYDKPVVHVWELR